MNGLCGWNEDALQKRFYPQWDKYPISLVSYYFGTENDLRVVIRAYDKNNIVLAEKTIENIHVYPNKRTLLTGKLFSGSNSVGIPITIDPDYSETTTINF